jgi:hypothetical protein
MAITTSNSIRVKPRARSCGKDFVCFTIDFIKNNLVAAFLPERFNGALRKPAAASTDHCGKRQKPATYFTPQIKPNSVAIGRRHSFS